MAVELESRLNQLDELLERYLELVNEYETARTELSKSIASGYFYLAKANNSGNKRFGQDYYDYRMQAQTVVEIQPAISEKEKSSISNGNVDSDSPSFQISIQASPESSEETKTKDPLTWFGMLVPQALRTAKESFSSVVEESVPKIVNISSQLRQMEIEIGRMRKSIKKLEKVSEPSTSSEKHAG